MGGRRQGGDDGDGDEPEDPLPDPAGTAWMAAYRGECTHGVPKGSVVERALYLQRVLPGCGSDSRVVGSHARRLARVATVPQVHRRQGWPQGDPEGAGPPAPPCRVEKK